jgi:hypothetical protein
MFPVNLLSDKQEIQALPRWLDYEVPPLSNDCCSYFPVHWSPDLEVAAGATSQAQRGFHQKFCFRPSVNW